MIPTKTQKLEMGKLIDSKTQAGNPIQVGNLEIVPLVRKVRLRSLNYRSTLLWGTPEAVIVQVSDGTQEILPIRDQTRRAQMLLLGFGILGSFLIWLAMRTQQN